MTTTQRTPGEILAELGHDLEFFEAVHDESRRNGQYFAAHCHELWESHKGKWMLIHDGSHVEAFDHYTDMMGRLGQLAPVARAAARTEKEAETSYRSW